MLNISWTDPTKVQDPSYGTNRIYLGVYDFFYIQGMILSVRIPEADKESLVIVYEIIDTPWICLKLCKMN